ncbi:hypothetical protein QVD17_25680 [Tagetes erecta]|uniref:Exocyst subunit Exo70 family protein n=1 Tax=Tagetes erecta TaxID=13708 RepID=A0AAD8NV79_TARER|nr:hypothetical protein QVD17_25680 [Tagetes erecta]
MEHLIHTRDLLHYSLHQSRQIDFQLHKTSNTLSRIDQTFPTLETAIKNMASQRATKDHVCRVLPTMSAVLDVYRLVNDLKTSVSAHSSSDLTRFTALLKRFKQALALLTNTCKLAITFLQHTNNVALDQDHLNVCKTLHLLKDLQETEACCLGEQGTLGVALRALEDEFKNLLIKNSFPSQLPSSLFSSGDDESDVSDSFPSPVMPFHVVQNLKAIVACFAACNNRMDRCVSIYVKVRSKTVEASLQGLDLDYLEISLSEVDSVQDIEGYIDEWGRHLEFVMKHMLEQEYTLCDQIFNQQDLHTHCFSKIAIRSGIQRFIKFANTVTKAKKEAIKLFKMLDIFTVLTNLRQDFNKFFGGKNCLEIQNQTRDLIKKVVNGSCEIFHELSAQIQLQRLMDPPPDGSVPRLVSYVTEYCEELLDDDYRLVLDQVLEINCSWYNVNKLVVTVEVHSIIKELELNLETWAKRYEERALSCVFIMNTSCYLKKHLKGTRLGELMGELWIKRHEDRVQYCMQLYLKESWSKLPVARLTNNDKIMVTEAKNRINRFVEAFDQEYRKQSRWVLSDDSLRLKTCGLIVEIILPVYTRCVHEYLGLVEGKGSHSPGNAYVKYSSERVQNMVSLMLQPKYDSNIKGANLMDRIKSVVAGRFSPTSVAA